MIYTNWLNKFSLLILLVFTSNVFAIGSKGPLESKVGIKNEKPRYLDKIGIDEHLGDQIDLKIPFVDDRGRDVVLGDYFKSEKPVMMLLVYYNCPTLCNTHMNSLVEMLREFEWRVGDKFDFVIVSIDPEEGPRLASKKKKSYLDLYQHLETSNHWHFLTGKQESITKIASQVGFKYFWDKEEAQWAHAAAAYILTPEGKISYYHYGLIIDPKVLRLSLVEASDNKIGSVMDRVLLFCLQYDPNKKTYSLYAYNLMKVVAGIFGFLLVGYLGKFWWQQVKNKNDNNIS